ncbi:hypothetical protein ABID21_002528 [Pseudorhizobium tarimense]|uniref:Uncharacterized protein n=1 Tax=Pseudorhizobium tarimense TaxID=1079109 RepID=A0ABV2H798_9HYPH|nr:hypothetical protein [Pseudorhizobium tarimense]MCJ8519738.1 hypothetical protein [Pseudorhizobium tarimense]
MTTSILARKRSFDTQQSRDAASWLGLAASPTFALMAGISANDMQAMTCASAPGILPIGGMAWMYLLMSVFHLPPWLKLASAHSPRRNTTITQTEGD